MMRSSARARFRFVLAVLVCETAGADSMAVPEVELREEASARYVLEARMGPLVAAPAPVSPERCSVDGPERETDDEAGRIRLRYAIDCAGHPLGPSDVLVLPWSVDGVRLTATWLDGTRRSGLFGREASGVVVRLGLILDRDFGFTELARAHAPAGWKHFWTHASHVLFVVALSLLGRGLWSGIGGLIAGHAMALVLAELGAVGLPRVPADAVVAGASVILMASVMRGDRRPRGVFPLAATLGTLHGLGMATELVASGVAPSSLVAALYATLWGLDLGAVVLALAAHWWVGGRGAKVAALVGSLGVVLLLSEMRAGLEKTPTARSSVAFVEADAFGGGAPVSASSLAAPAAQLDGGGELAEPFLSYVVVEPYQVRHEVLVEVRALGEWLDVPVEPPGAIPIARQEALTAVVAALVADRSPLAIDGAPVRPAATRADFVRLGADGASIRLTPVPEPLDTAVLGITLVYETESFAESITVDWGLFSDDVTTVPASVTDPAAVVETALTPEAPRLTWRNTLEGHELSEIEAIAAVKPRVPLLSLGLAGLGLVALVAARRRTVAACCLAGAYVLYPFARVEASVPLIGEARIDRALAAEVIEKLLTNVYRSFDIHDEELIYDRLALTVTGEQLLDVYLESRRALELENRGGARVRIDDVVVREVRAIRAIDGGGYELETLWTVGGSVNHFGHVHFRQNQYAASITILPVEDTWKIQSMELLEEKRVL